MNLFNPDKIEFWIMIFIVFIALIISSKFLDNAKFNIVKSMNQMILRYGLVSKRMICELTSDRFVLWCVDLLSRLGYTNIELLPYPAENGKYLKCRRNSISYFVVCVQLDLKKSPLHEDDYVPFEGLIHKNL